MNKAKCIALVGIIYLTSSIMAKKQMSRTQPSAVLEPKTIRVKNEITDSMISYKRLGTSHKPTFTVRINGQTVPRGQAVQVPNNKTIEVEYDFDFYGIRKGTRKESFKPDPKKNSTELTFTWHDKHKMKLNGATVIEK